MLEFHTPAAKLAEVLCGLAALVVPNFFEVWPKASRAWSSRPRTATPAWMFTPPTSATNGDAKVHTH